MRKDHDFIDMQTGMMPDRHGNHADDLNPAPMLIFESGFEKGWPHEKRAAQANNMVKISDSFYISDFICGQNPVQRVIKAGSLMLKNAAHDKQEILSNAIALLAKSTMGRRLLKEAENRNWQVALEDLNGPDFHIDIPEKMIVLDAQGMSAGALMRSAYFFNTIVMTLTRALRDIWQEQRCGAFDEDFGPEAVLTLERIRAADLDIIAVMVAWELRGQDKTGLWRHILGSEEGDLAQRYAGYLQRDPTSDLTHPALAAAFTQWFRDPARVDACDHETLSYLDAVMTTHHVGNPFGDKRVAPIDIERLSCLPDKTAYLQGKGKTILSDPLYAGMNDPINQTHLMHILYDLKVVHVENVPFRDIELAGKIFPEAFLNNDEKLEDDLWEEAFFDDEDDDDFFGDTENDYEDSFLFR
ncbi:MAG: DUF6782 family putative metallopeptidase [Bdellovibrionales bacterium]